jgi:hypothetical protein
VGEADVRMLLYADDAVLLAERAEELQARIIYRRIGNSPPIRELFKVHSHVCFKATYKLLSEQLATSPLVESDFLATFKLLCSIHVNVPLI